MTKLTPMIRKELARQLAVPARYRELKPRLEACMAKTPYRRIPSFEHALRKDGLLQQIDLKAETGQTAVLYASTAPEGWSPYQVAQALCPNGYFCNLTSVYHHALTNQVPSRIYMTIEGTRVKDHRHAETTALTDAAIFDAFMKPHRMSRHNFKFLNHVITITERVSRDCAGVETVRRSDHVCPKGSRVTCLERMIIDAVVHPQYNGGLSTVVETLRHGLPRVDPRRLLDIYDQLAYVYPYWQAIGFLCGRTGCTGMAAAIAKRFKPKNKFYLDHGAKTSWAFDPKWQIYYPGSMI